VCTWRPALGTYVASGFSRTSSNRDRSAGIVRSTNTVSLLSLDYGFDAAVVAVSALAGALAAITGFGIGSLITPLFALMVDTRLAVAAVSIPHVAGTALRFALLSGGIDRRVLVQFGLTSAAGGLIGALLHTRIGNRWLTLVFGALLLFAAFSQATGLARRLRFRGQLAWIAGALSGLLGGLVGNQGGIRSAALLGFDLSKTQFVATATAVALFVDGARLPVYVATEHDAMLALWRPISYSILGVVVGTLAGSRALTRIPEVWFHRVLALVLALLGVVMLARS
jgi:uncharacterized membrane protein YfcA